MESSPLSLQLVDKFRNPLICLLFFHFVHNKKCWKNIFGGFFKDFCDPKVEILVFFFICLCLVRH